MSNNSTFTVACALCVGADPEPYLPATLASIANAVDVLAVNDNSGLARSSNVAAIEASAFAERGALRLERHPFVDFADMRNRAFAALAAFPQPPDWVLFLDADEVHGEQLRYIAREVLPTLGPRYGNVDAYTYHFWGTFRWITDIARRFVFYRYDPRLRWTNAVHEKIDGLRGRALVVPYVYHHYGNVQSPAALTRKHLRYYDLGNAVPRPPAVEAADASLYLAKAAQVRPFAGRHPRVARALLAELEAGQAAEFAALDAGFAALRTPAVRLGGTLRALNESLRVQLRRLEHPGLQRAAGEAR
jgi:hypothetical protein